MEFLGWYTTGGPPDQSDIHIHKQVGKRVSMYSIVNVLTFSQILIGKLNLCTNSLKLKARLSCCSIDRDWSDTRASTFRLLSTQITAVVLLLQRFCFVNDWRSANTEKKQTRCSAIISSQVDDLNFYFVVGNKSKLSVVTVHFCLLFPSSLVRCVRLLRAPSSWSSTQWRNTPMWVLLQFCFKNEKISWWFIQIQLH